MASIAPSPTTSPMPSAASDQPAPSCTTAVPGQYGNVPSDACNSNYNFDPQYIPAVVVAIIFGILSAVHIAEAAIFKKRYAWVVIMGGLWETVAFIFGALGAHDQQNSSFAVGHQLLFLLAPLWINAFVYMTLARMMHFYLPDQKVWRIKSTSMSKIFVWADVVTFLIQAGGGSIATPGADPNTIKIGLDVYTAGVAIQEACIIAFVILMVMFHRKAAALDSTSGYLRSSASELNPDGVDEFFMPKKGWKAQVYAIYVVLGLITLRIGYRIAEFASGVDPTTNPLPFNEAYAYGLDAAPIIVALIVLTIFHPGRVLQGRNSDFTEFRKQKKEAKKVKKETKRMEKAEKKAAKAGKQLRVDSIGSPYESA